MLTTAFILLPAILFAGFAFLTWPISRKPVLIYALWIAVTGILAARHVLSFTTTPPTMFIAIGGTFVLTLLFATSRTGLRVAESLPLWALVAWQSFRLPLELAMHQAAKLGAMPVQMSFTGRNFDIVTGVTALIVALLVAKGVGGKKIVLIWNVMGALLLINVLSIALTLRPVFVTQFPFVWLPVVMVANAVAGHVLIFRYLRNHGSDSASHLPLRTAEARVGDHGRFQT